MISQKRPSSGQLGAPSYMTTVAPLLKGQQVGALRVRTASGEPVAEVPLTVLETVEESGVLGRAWDALRLWIQ